jgi:hypothetical protein
LVTFDIEGNNLLPKDALLLAEQAKGNKRMNDSYDK